jgi:hypothetical protein
MAQEVQINGGLSVLFPSGAPYRRQFSFTRDLVLNEGPTPGFLTAPTTGVQIDLSKLTNASVMWIQNLSTNARLEIGMKDTSSTAFEPLLEIEPLEAWPIPLARQIGSELTSGAGTGTAGSGAVLWAKGVGASVNFIAEAFGR